MALIAEAFDFRGVRYEARWVNCNKKACERCPHGPYWYAIISLFGQRPVVRYVGKQLKGPVAKYYTDHYNGETPDA